MDQFGHSLFHEWGCMNHESEQISDRKREILRKLKDHLRERDDLGDFLKENREAIREIIIVAHGDGPEWNSTKKSNGNHDKDVDGQVLAAKRIMIRNRNNKRYDRLVAELMHVDDVPDEGNGLEDDLDELGLNGTDSVNLMFQSAPESTEADNNQTDGAPGGPGSCSHVPMALEQEPSSLESCGVSSIEGICESRVLTTVTTAVARGVTSVDNVAVTELQDVSEHAMNDPCTGDSVGVNGTAPTEALMGDTSVGGGVVTVTMESGGSAENIIHGGPGVQGHVPVRLDAGPIDVEDVVVTATEVSQAQILPDFTNGGAPGELTEGNGGVQMLPMVVPEGAAHGMTTGDESGGLPCGDPEGGVTVMVKKRPGGSHGSAMAGPEGEGNGENARTGGSDECRHGIEHVGHDPSGSEGAGARFIEQNSPYSPIYALNGCDGMETTQVGGTGENGITGGPRTRGNLPVGLVTNSTTTEGVVACATEVLERCPPRNAVNGRGVTGTTDKSDIDQSVMDVTSGTCPSVEDDLLVDCTSAVVSDSCTPGAPKVGVSQNALSESEQMEVMEDDKYGPDDLGDLYWCAEDLTRGLQVEPNATVALVDSATELSAVRIPLSTVSGTDQMEVTNTGESVQNAMPGVQGTCSHSDTTVVLGGTTTEGVVACTTGVSEGDAAPIAGSVGQAGDTTTGEESTGTGPGEVSEGSTPSRGESDRSEAAGSGGSDAVATPSRVSDSVGAASSASAKKCRATADRVIRDQCELDDDGEPRFPCSAQKRERQKTKLFHDMECVRIKSPAPKRPCITWEMNVGGPLGLVHIAFNRREIVFTHPDSEKRLVLRIPGSDKMPEKKVIDLTVLGNDEPGATSEDGSEEEEEDDDE